MPITVARTKTARVRLPAAAIVVALLLLLGPSCIAAQAADLKVKSTGPGTISINPTSGAGKCPDPDGWCRFLYPPRWVTLTATPIGPGSSFATWLGDCTGSQRVCRLPLDRPRTAIARFAPVQLRVRSRLGGAIDVQGGTGCGETCWAFGYGAVATLTAQPEAGRTFGLWGGLCAGSPSTCRRQVFEPTGTTAFFGCVPGVEECVDEDRSPLDRPMKIKIRRFGRGSLMVNGKVCTQRTCDAAFERSQRVAIKPRKGGRLLRWEGACQGQVGWCFFSAFSDGADRVPYVNAVFE